MGTQTTDSPKLPDNSIDVDEKKKEWMKHVRYRFKVLQSAWSNIHEEARDDDRFVAGYQWRDDIRTEREDDGRPILTYNLLLNYVNQITNQVRQNWPQAKIVPVEGDRDTPQRIKNTAGTKDYSMAEVYSGIMRHIEHVSRADQAYDTAVEHSTAHGFGFFRAITQYSNDDGFEQEIRIKRVKNSYNVLVDLSGEEADFSDMNDAFVSTTMNKSIFEKKYPGVPFTQLDKSSTAFYDGWYDEDAVRIAEYYYIEHEKDEVIQLSDGTTTYLSKVKDVLDELEEKKGITVLRRRSVLRPQCKWEKVTADEILEGPIDIPSRYVPIFPVIGKEFIIDGQVEFHSAIRHAKDAQMSYNYWRTAAAETVALAPKAPYIMTREQKIGHEPEWDNANSTNYSTLTYNFVEGHPLPQRQFASQVAAAELSNATNDKQDIQDIIGLHEASMGAQGNEKSGKAIKARQAVGNMATFIFPDNLSRAIEQCTRVCIEMIPQVMTMQAVQRIQLPGDMEDFVEINRVEKDDETDEWVTYDDIGYGKYDVRIDTGPSYESIREESTDSMLSLMKILPPDKVDSIAHLLVKNMDFKGADDIYDILRKMLPEELKTEEEKAQDLPEGFTMGEDGVPVDENGEPMKPPPPTPEQELMSKQLDADNKEADAKMAKADADTRKAEADMMEADLKMAELQQGPADQGDNQAGGEEMITGLIARMEELIADNNEQIDEKITKSAVDVLQRVRKATPTKAAATEA